MDVTSNTTNPPPDNTFADATSPETLTNITNLVNATLSNVNLTITSNGTNTTAISNNTVAGHLLGAIIGQTENATMTQQHVDPNAISLQTYGDMQRGYLNAAIFGGLVCWGVVVLIQALQTLHARRKPLYALNAIQALFALTKTFSAALYAVVQNLPCVARSPLMNVPLVLAWDTIYAIMLMKLLLFARWKRACQAFYAVGVTTHFVLVMVAISQREWRMNSLGLCADRYTILYKQQYIIELVIESFTAIALLHGLSYHGNHTGGMLSGTQHILKQLTQNEHCRIFFVMIFISLKILSTYAGLSNNIVALTHAIDSARSALVCWALIREQRKVAQTAALETSSQNNNAPRDSSTSAKKLNNQPSKMVVAKYASARESDTTQPAMVHHAAVSRGVSAFPGQQGVVLGSSVPRGRAPGVFDAGRMGSVAGSVPRYLKGTGAGLGVGGVEGSSVVTGHSVLDHEESIV
ncbi:hypothetical protein HDV00_002028 [Rhizophlyctis rosea]|nr:hypothetical protein HDV00_002028 [Rhizophlyctis rosea]